MPALVGGPARRSSLSDSLYEIDDCRRVGENTRELLGLDSGDVRSCPSSSVVPSTRCSARGPILGGRVFDEPVVVVVEGEVEVEVDDAGVEEFIVQGTDQGPDSNRLPTNSEWTFLFCTQALRTTIPLQCECLPSFSASSTYFRMLFILSSVEPMNRLQTIENRRTTLPPH